jgi:hypothetical protein
MSRGGHSGIPRAVVILAALVAGRGCVCFGGDAYGGCEVTTAPCDAGGDGCPYVPETTSECALAGGTCVASVAVCNHLLPDDCAGAGVCCAQPDDAAFDSGPGPDAESDAADAPASDGGLDGQDAPVMLDAITGDGPGTVDAIPEGGDAGDARD